MSSRRCSKRPAGRWSWPRDRPLEHARRGVPRERGAPFGRGSRPARRVGEGPDGARRGDGRRSCRTQAAPGRLRRRDRRSGAGDAGRRRVACGASSLRGRQLRRRRHPHRAAPLRRRRCGRAGDGARFRRARARRRQPLSRRPRRGGGTATRSDARAQLRRGGVARAVRAGRSRGRGGRARRHGHRRRSVACPSGMRGRRGRARASSAVRPPLGRPSPDDEDRAQGTKDLMAVIVDRETRLVVQGLTGSEGRFHGLRNRNYGTNVVAGVTPGKGGLDVEGIPVFNTVAEAVSEAVDAGIATVICITEHIPAHDMLRVYTYIRQLGITLIGPNCPGVLSPGKANVGIIPAEIFTEGNVGLVSRSGTLTYQIGHELTQLGLGNSTIVGIGGDPVVGSSFIDVLEKFEADAETEYVVLVGEIGGNEEEKAAAFIEERMSTPVFAYIAGFSAPPGKTMGHAGAIISGTSGTAQAKKDALEAAGIVVGTTPTEVAQLVAERVGVRA